MAKAGKKRESGISTARIITLIISLLVLGLLIAEVWIYIDRKEAKETQQEIFTVEIDGKRVQSDLSLTYFTAGRHSATVAATGDDGFDVVIKPKDGTAFEFTADGEPLQWSDEKDLGAAFSLEKTENGFTFTVPHDVAAVLGKIHEGQIQVPSKLPDEGCIFSLIISSKGLTYEVDFCIIVGPIDAEEFELDKNHYVFIGEK